VLHDIRHMPMSLHEPLVTRFKEMAEMNLIEKRLPQDGRVRIIHEDKEYDVRMSVLPTLQGETIVMRLIDQSSTRIGLDRLGMDRGQIDFLCSCIHRPSGLLLVTGPTGSGKTTLLYSCLLEIDASGAKVLTVEDPIECRIPDVVQVQVNRRNGLTFAAAMRSILRHDPDVILCGELPDRETVEVTLQAALTGQVVFSCLHADDTLAAVNRLVDIGIERYLITSSLNAIVATRRARRLCPDCKTVVDSTSLAAKVKPLAERGGYRIPSDAVFYGGAGCERCRGTGFLGRLNLYEVLPCNPKLVARLIESESADVMIRLAVESGMRTLLADGVRKAVEGETSLPEILRVTDAGI
jgi:type II secretory ATPase GspE/PulE/Tfp pilus assembly ATPase PilB-like protein